MFDIGKYLLVGTIATGIWLFMFGRHYTKTEFIERWLFGIYLTMLFAITISPVYGISFPQIKGSFNFMPFAVFSSLPGGMLNFVGNILLFVPMGILLFLLNSKRRNSRIILCGPLISVLIEFIQLFSVRGTDIDDVLLNSFGTILGWLCTRMIFLVCHKSKRKHVYKFRPLSYICISFIAVMVVGFSTTCSVQNKVLEQSESKPKPKTNIQISIKGKEGLLICTDTNEMIWEKGSEDKIAPASCTKLLTALTVMKYCEPEEVITVGDEISLIAKDSTRSYLQQGEQLSVRQALIAMLLPSGNDSAYTLAVYTGRKAAFNPNLSIELSVEKFVDEMNSLAEELGANASNFCTPDGYDSDGQYTTAYDLAIIGKNALENDLLAQIVSMSHSKETWISGEVGEYRNTNEMLSPESSYYLPECVGLKTGTSEEAGACLIVSFDVGMKKYIGVVMGSTEESRYDDALKIYNIIPESTN